jgi:hypothetical protein
MAGLAICHALTRRMTVAISFLDGSPFAPAAVAQEITKTESTNATISWF